MEGLKIIDTGDGSHTLYNKALDETYHSTHGALTESQHVFIKEGLQFKLDTLNTKEISILEVGFGTGLNALLTCLEAEKTQIKIYYHTLEPYPVDAELLDSLNYTLNLPQKAKAIFNDLHQATWEERHSITPFLDLHKLQATLESFRERNKFDVVYFDAFAPRKQPELWENAALSCATNSLKQHGVFVTYSAMGALKRNLKALGLEVSSISGPPGKREMTRGIKI